MFCMKKNIQQLKILIKLFNHWTTSQQQHNKCSEWLLQFNIIDMHEEFHHSDYQQLCKSDKNQEQFWYTILINKNFQKIYNN